MANKVKQKKNTESQGTGNRERMAMPQVWADYGNQIRQFFRSRVSTPEDAEDLMQEVLLKTHQRLPTLKEPEKFHSWLFQIARHTLTDFYRKQGDRGRHVDISEFEEVLKEPPKEESSVFSELNVCLQPFLRQLPDKYREALEAVDLKGTSPKKLAAKLGVSHSAIKSRVQRGRHKLSELFQDCCTYSIDARGNIIAFEETSECCESNHIKPMSHCAARDSGLRR